MPEASTCQLRVAGSIQQDVVSGVFFAAPLHADAILGSAPRLPRSSPLVRTTADYVANEVRQNPQRVEAELLKWSRAGNIACLPNTEEHIYIKVSDLEPDDSRYPLALSGRMLWAVTRMLSILNKEEVNPGSSSMTSVPGENGFFNVNGSAAAHKDNKATDEAKDKEDDERSKRSRAGESDESSSAADPQQMLSLAKAMKALKEKKEKHKKHKQESTSRKSQILASSEAEEGKEALEFLTLLSP